VRRLVSWLLVPVLVLALAACGGDAGERAGGDDAVPDSLRYGGALVIGAYGDLQSMNALTSSDFNANSIQREMLFMPLIQYNENIEPVPWLAERWDTVRVHPDTLELTWHLRRDIRWHDGPPTTAEDVRFTLERMHDERTAFPNYQRIVRYSPHAEVVDPYTVRMRLQPHADFMDIWYQTVIMPRHILGDVAPDQLLQHPFQHQPVGNGPFRFVRREPGQEWIFEANPDFPAALGGRPYLDRVVWRNIPEMTTLLTELLTGRVDMYIQPNPNQADQIRSAAGVRLVDYPSRQWNYFAFNTRRPQFRDARVRRAIAMSIDRQQIVDALVYGFGEPGRGTVVPGTWMFDATREQTELPYDTAAARRLLAEAGWTQGRDGLMRNAQGEQLRFTPITNFGNDLRRDILQMIEAQLRPLGITVTPRLIEWTTFIQTLQDPRRNFDALVGGWVDYFQKDDTNILHSRNVDGPYQYVGYSNPRVDQLLDALILEMDRDRARPMWQEYQRLVVQDAAYVPLYYPRRLAGLRDRVRDSQHDIRGDLVGIHRWWLSDAARTRQGARGAAPAGAPADTQPTAQ
jgi:peptide/nickel transport system substrate-binding protein